MNKIIWIINNRLVENYLLESIVQTLNIFPDGTIEVFIENKDLQKKDLKNLQSLKTIDIHFKSFKKNPFSKMDLSGFIHPRLKIIAQKEDLSVSDWVVFSDNQECDFEIYEHLVKNGILAFDLSIKELVGSILQDRKELSLNFILKTKGEVRWKTISNMSFNVDKGILNALEKKAWLYPLSLSKFLLNQNDYTIVLPKQKFKVSNYKFSKYYLRLLAIILRRKLKKEKLNWKIGFKKNGGEITMLPQPKGSFWADPFLVKEDESYFLFI